MFITIATYLSSNFILCPWESSNATVAKLYWGNERTPGAILCFGVRQQHFSGSQLNPFLCIVVLGCLEDGDTGDSSRPTAV